MCHKCLLNDGNECLICHFLFSLTLDDIFPFSLRHLLCGILAFKKHFSPDALRNNLHEAANFFADSLLSLSWENCSQKSQKSHQLSSYLYGNSSSQRIYFLRNLCTWRQILSLTRNIVYHRIVNQLLTNLSYSTYFREYEKVS